MLEHETDRKSYDECLNNVWREKVTIVDGYEKHRPEFVSELEVLEDLWDDQLERINISKHRSEIAFDHVWTV